MKKLTMLALACIIGLFSVSFTGCGPGKAKDARTNPDAADKAIEESKKKTKDQAPK